jgi:molybdenum cofactor cytidylyltransferase
MTPITTRKFPDVPGVVLAGGRSLRMGRLKALLPWPASNLPFVLHVTNTLRDAGAHPVGVVTGAHHDALAPVLAQAGVPALFNPRHEDGQLSSLLHGLQWAFSHTDGDWTLVTLVDVPDVAVDTVRALIAASRDTAARAVRPAIGDRHGHPVLWHRATLPLLFAADPSHGGRAVMHALVAAGQVLDVPVDDDGVLRDIDTPADYLRVEKQE